MKTIDYDALELFFKKHINKETLEREISSLSTPNPFDPTLEHSQFIRGQRTIINIIRSGTLYDLAEFMKDVKMHICANYIFKEKRITSSTIPMLGLMREIYNVLSVFVTYSRRTSLDIKDIRLISERTYEEYLKTWAVHTKQVSKDIIHLIDWNKYVDTVVKINPPIELDLTQTLYSSGLFHIHYPQPITKHRSTTKLSNKDEGQAREGKVSIDFYLKDLEAQTGLNKIPNKNMRNPFNRNRKYGTYDPSSVQTITPLGLTKEAQPESVGTITVESIEDVSPNLGFELNLGNIVEIIPPKERKKRSEVKSNQTESPIASFDDIALEFKI